MNSLDIMTKFKETLSDSSIKREHLRALLKHEQKDEIIYFLLDELKALSQNMIMLSDKYRLLIKKYDV